MILHCYLPVRNDLYMMRYYVRYYWQFASKIFAYDDNSDDGTREFLESCDPFVKIMPLGFTGIDEVLYTELWESEYKKHSRDIADWVILGDSDEFIYHPHMKTMLEVMRDGDYAGITCHGYQMMAESRPEGDGQLTEYVKNGVRDVMYDRLIFRPSLDVEVPPGKHHVKITSPGDHPIVEHESFKMLHYRWLGREHVLARNKQLWDACSQRNKEHGWGVHNSPEWKNNIYSLEWYERTMKEAKPCLE